MRGAFLANFAGLTRHIIAVPIPGRDNAMPPDRLADAARALGMRVETAASVEAALHALSRLAYEVPPRILITARSISPAMCLRSTARRRDKR